MSYYFQDQYNIYNKLTIIIHLLEINLFQYYLINLFLLKNSNNYYLAVFLVLS